MTLANLRIGAKLAFAFTLTTLLTIVLGVMAWAQLSRVAAGTDDIAGNWLPSVQAIGNLRVAGNRMRRTESELFIPLQHPDLAKALTDLDARRTDLDKADGVYAKLVTEGQERTLYTTYQAKRATYLAEEAKLVDMLKANAPHDELLARYFGESNRLYASMNATLNELTEFNRKSADQAYSDVRDVYANARTMVAVLLAVIVVLSVLLAWWITRLITVPLALAVEMASKVAEGDLTMQVSVTGKDESAQLMQALSGMRDSLARVVGDVRSNAEGVATASAQIEQGNHDLSGRTEQQAAALEETAASMEELSSTVRQNSDNAQQASKLATDASSVATRGGQVVGEVVATMKGIDEASRRIADIIGVIDSIAFQTNILALNAAVEAARAGEQGRGFAVVASEVRSLAGRSADAAKEIKTLIDTSVERVSQGSALVDRAGATMSDVVQAIQRVAGIVSEISVATREQSAGVTQVGETVTQMDQATQQNAALVEESAAAASSLKSQAQQLVQAVSVFRLAGGGRAGGHHGSLALAGAAGAPRIAA